MNIRLGLLRDTLLALVFHVAPRFANVIIFIIIGRLSGPDQAGVFALATTYLLIITTLMRGLDDLLIRQVAREPERAGSYFWNFLALRIVLATLTYVALISIVQNVPNYSAATAAPIAIIALSVVPDSLAFVAQSVLLGNRRFGAPAVIQGGVNLLKMIVGVIVLLRGEGLMSVAWVWLFGSSLGMMALLAVTVKHVGGLHAADWLDFSPLRLYWRTALSFSAITVLTALDSQTDTVLLSIFRGEAEVGWYNAATTVTSSLLMLVQAYRFAIYPLMTHHAQNAPDKLMELFQKSIHYMGVVAIPMVTGIILLAPQIVKTVFGTKFMMSATPLLFLAISLLFYFVGEPCNRLMLVNDRQRLLVAMLVISASSNILINIFLIPAYGAVGSGLARICSSAIFFTLNYGYITRKLFRRASLKGLAKPTIASIAMALVILLVRENTIYIVIPAGIVTYGLALWLVNGVSPDDFNRLKHLV
jgi:O-antigen/teichoic acid export membrane protein